MHFRGARGSPIVLLTSHCCELSGRRERAHAYRNCRRRPDGREHGSAPDGDRQQAHGLESLGRQDQAVGGRRRGRRQDAGRACRRGRGRHHHPDQRRRDRRGLSRPAGPAVGRREGQAVHRDEHGAAGGRRSRWPRRCAPRARPMSNARSAAASRRRAPASCSATWAREPADAARARPILDQLCRRVHARRPGRLGRGAQARGQPAADDLLAGARRAARHVQGR